MRKLLTALFVLTLCVEMISCRRVAIVCDSPDLPYQVLTDSIKSWLPYTSNTDIVFENSSFQNDTLLLRDYFNGDDLILRGGECGPGSGQFKRCNFIDPVSSDTIYAEIGYQYIFSTYQRPIFVSYNDNIKDVGLPTAYRKFEKTITLNSKQFSNCVWVECTSSDNCDPSGITKYYFAKDKGLIAFVRNAVLWTLK